MDEAIAREIVERQARGERFAVALLAHVQGSAPQKAGARLIVLPDGTMRGTVGGGCLEMETRRRALIALRTGESLLFDLRLDDDFGWDDGLICGGKTLLVVSPHPERVAPALAQALAARDRGERCCLVSVLASPDTEQVGQTYTVPPDGGIVSDLSLTVAPPPGIKPVVQETENGVRLLLEPLRPPPTLVVVGCGHIGSALIEIAASVGFDVIAADDRVDYAHPDRLPGAKQTVCDDLPMLARTLPSGPDTYWVIVTRGHRNDGRVLAAVLPRSWGYLGMIGSRRKVRLIREGILTADPTMTERLAQVYSPIGLDIGAESPREIALSIAAQLIAVRQGKGSVRSTGE